ncbi:hypothetical protein WOLCODRAFT_20992 [Wolfiporia cocos MD-104 SS10]|uniref:Uncharacterized protein n=1 Tax=Wolfiporia cocos (strain MD-104) TaxID=742152 RepID=A0A2H3J4U5_WOLCO|nr:hypothetical protein WOLCODRAFT_20992 [Wolfiporia cocos MD-104 SS10]
MARVMQRDGQSQRRLTVSLYCTSSQMSHNAASNNFRVSEKHTEGTCQQESESAYIDMQAVNPPIPQQERSPPSMHKNGSSPALGSQQADQIDEACSTINHDPRMSSEQHSLPISWHPPWSKPDSDMPVITPQQSDYVQTEERLNYQESHRHCSGWCILQREILARQRPAHARDEYINNTGANAQAILRQAEIPDQRVYLVDKSNFLKSQPNQLLLFEEHELLGDVLDILSSIFPDQQLEVPPEPRNTPPTETSDTIANSDGNSSTKDHELTTPASTLSKSADNISADSNVQSGDPQTRTKGPSHPMSTSQETSEHSSLWSTDTGPGPEDTPILGNIRPVEDSDTIADPKDCERATPASVLAETADKTLADSNMPSGDPQTRTEISSHLISTSQEKNCEANVDTSEHSSPQSAHTGPGPEDLPASGNIHPAENSDTVAISAGCELTTPASILPKTADGLPVDAGTLMPMLEQIVLNDLPVKFHITPYMEETCGVKVEACGVKADTSEVNSNTSKVNSDTSGVKEDTSEVTNY